MIYSRSYPRGMACKVDEMSDTHGTGQRSDITVVIISLLGGAALARCLAAVTSFGLTSFIVHTDGSVVAAGRLIAPAGARDVPTRRRRGAEAATTPVVAFLEDTVVPSMGWAEQIASTLADGSGVAGVAGPIAIDAHLSSRAAALAVTEFGRYQKSALCFDDGPAEASALPGANFAFRRDCLLAATAATGRLVDQETFGNLQRQGWKLVLQPTMAVTYANPHPEGAALATRYFHGRMYAGQVNMAASPLRRLRSALVAIALPVVLSSRAMRVTPRGLRAPFATRFWIVLQQSAWSIGEFVGAIFGPPASGFERWR